MIAIDRLETIKETIRSLNITEPADKQLVYLLVRNLLGLDQGAQAMPDSNDAVLSIAEAARRLARRPRTIQYYVATGQLIGFHTGRSHRLTGIPASEIDAFIKRNTDGGSAI